jgi:hypothetical protein
VTRPQTILFLAADTSELAPLDLEAEARAIEVKLQAAPQGQAFTLLSHFATTPDDLQATLLREQPTIVHFSGHGAGAGDERPGLVLHGDREGEVKIVSGPALAGLFSVLRGQVALVVLNACHSFEQARDVAEAVGFAVGMRGAIRDESARVFAAALYRGLGFGRTLKSAFDLGVNALMLEGLDDDDLPMLVAREGADPDTHALVEAPASASPGDEGWDVFLAYDRTDRGPAQALALALHERDFRVFFDEWEIGAGEVVLRRLEDGIRASKNGILLVSAAAMQPVLAEEYMALLQRAVEHDKRLIPVIVGDAELPPFLASRSPVDLRGKTGEALGIEVEAIARALRGLRPGPPLRAGRARA